jgi:hypothetical protein
LANGGFVSAAHGESEIDATAIAFAAAVQELAAFGAI